MSNDNLFRRPDDTEVIQVEGCRRKGKELVPTGITFAKYLMAQKIMDKLISHKRA